MKIGFYDSGVGGFCVLNKFLDLCRDGQLDFLDGSLSIIYLADTKNCPLGDKDIDLINQILQKNVQYLFDLGCDLIILACNTATAVSIRFLQKHYASQPDFSSKKILGIIKPVTEHILELNLPINSKIAVLATPASIKTNFYQQEIKALGFESVVGVSLLGLAKAIEENNYTLAKAIIIDKIINHTTQLQNTKVVILGCTHYPIIKDIFSEVLAKYLSFLPIIVTQEDLVATKLANYLQKHYSKNNINIDLENLPITLFLQVLCTEDCDFFASKLLTVFGLSVECELVNL